MTIGGFGGTDVYMSGYIGVARYIVLGYIYTHYRASSPFDTKKYVKCSNAPKGEKYIG